MSKKIVIVMNNGIVQEVYSSFDNAKEKISLYIEDEDSSDEQVKEIEKVIKKLYPVY